MNQFFAITKKEFYESVATYRFYILLAVFAIFGMMSPLFARLAPEILNSMGDMGGITIIMTEPTALDSWGQFFNNVGQMGMIVLVIIFSGIMSNEFSKGTLVNLLTKGLKRHTVILSKFLSSSLMWTAAYLLCLVLCYLYTAHFWEIGTIDNAFIVFGAPWLFGILMISLLIFGGTLFGNIFGSLLSCLAVVITLNIISIVSNAARFNPISLLSGTLSLLNGTGEPSDFTLAMAICGVMIALLILGSIAVFNKKRV